MKLTGILFTALTAAAQEPALPPSAAAPPAAPASVDVRTPRIWIFNGTPGDDEHHLFYEKNLASLRKSLTDRFSVPADRITVLYGPQTAGYNGPCTREAMLAELEKVTVHLKQPGAAPAWIIFEGHANAITGGAMFNLPGPDLSARAVGDALKTVPAGAPLVVLMTTTCSAPFLKHMAGPGRIIITAATAADKENETEFPSALAETLAADVSDSSGDGVLSLTELFQATNAGVLRLYAQGNFIVKEHAELDGNGDGKATQRPAPEDAAPADRMGLKLTPPAKKFD